MKVNAVGMNTLPEQERYIRAQKADDVKPKNQKDDEKPDKPVTGAEYPKKYDEYIPSDYAKNAMKPDKENGDDKKAESPEKHKAGSPKSGKSPEAPKETETSETTTLSTDKVDREIEKLKAKKTSLEQELRTADESRRDKIEKELKQVDAELSRKDNEEYRKRHAVKI